MDKKLRIRNDLILAAVLVCAALSVWTVLSLTRSKGEYAVVQMDGRTIVSYPLNEDAEVELRTEDGHVNMLVISNGCADVIDADCPDRLCVKQKPISKIGQTIVCLPHKLIICISDSGAAEP